MAPSKKIKIADLKANLSRYLRDIKAGQSITVVDRNSPIALLIPLGTPNEEMLSVRAPIADPKKLGNIRSPLKKRKNFSSLDILAELRGDK